MITNSKLTLYHKVFNKLTRQEEWVRYNYDYVWFFGGKGAGINKGYDSANDVDVRIPYDSNAVDINNISIGDIIVGEEIKDDISTQQDLKNYTIYNVTSINNNKFGLNQHIHLGGK